MSVYVDAPLYVYKTGLRKMIMCHMIADDLEELHEMAAFLGLKRRWFQDTNNPHYDICKSKRAQALKLGAIELNRREMVDKIKALRLHR